jgi:hypothetical protein
LAHLLLCRELVELIVQRAQAYEELIARDRALPVKADDLIKVRIDRGRDEDCSSPPAQIPACAANAPGSSLGSWRRSGVTAAGAGS